MKLRFRLHEGTLIAAAGLVFSAFVFPYHVGLREAMNPDGVSYLDFWHAPWNAYWAPLLPLVVLIFSGLRGFFGLESFAYVQLGLGLVSACLFAAVAFLVRELWRADARPFGPEKVVQGGFVFATAIWAYTVLIGPQMLTPDGLAGVFAIVAAAILLRARRLGHPTSIALALGVCLWLGYLAKYPMFVFGWLLLGLYFRNSPRFVAIAGATFLALALFWIVPLSLHLGYFSFAETGRLNLAWFTGQAPMYSGYGLAIDSGATFAEWLDPVSAHAGLKVRVDAAHLLRNVVWHCQLLGQSRTLQLVGLVLALLLLCQRPRLDWRVLWPMLAIVSYLPLTLMSRYAAIWLMLVVVFWKAGPRLQITLTVLFLGASVLNLGQIPAMAAPFDAQLRQARAWKGFRGQVLPVEGDLFAASMTLKRIDARIQSRDHGESRFSRSGHYGLSHGPQSH